MSGPLRITFPGAFYHITSRGNQRRNIIKSNRDAESVKNKDLTRFLNLGCTSVEKYGSRLHSLDMYQ